MTSESVTARISNRLSGANLRNVGLPTKSNESVAESRMVKGTVGFGFYLLFVVFDIWLIVLHGGI
jgi:hypothetical protein